MTSENNKGEYVPMDCPVCGGHFSECHDVHTFEVSVLCLDCGWHYDLEQTQNPDLKAGDNEMSLTEYRAWYQEQLRIDPKFNFGDAEAARLEPHPCPICGKTLFPDELSFERCTECGWFDDFVEGGLDCHSNGIGHEEYKRQYEEILKKEPSYRFDTDGKRICPGQLKTSES